MKLGSLFDGIGGFPLVATRNNITPVWASEIEKGPVEITKKHFPNMKHLGDVTKINGAQIDPVDIITFGSPCQDLSIAGKRGGLQGARSGLFMEAVRIIKEMREAHNAPRFAVWENVPGAFSSNAGEDFRVVLDELCRVKEPGYSVPAAKWEPAGLVEGDGWSIAWRVLDAQFWGVPQRRKRIFLVADFGGDSAGQILFEPESLRWDSAPGGGKGQGAAADAAGGAGTAGGGPAGGAGVVGYDAYQHHNWRQANTLGPLTTMGCSTVRGDTPLAMRGGAGTTIWDMTHADEVMRPVDGDKVNTLNGRMGTGGNQVQVVCQPTMLAVGVSESPDLAHCLRSGASKADKHESTTYVLAEPAYWDGGQVADCMDASNASKQQAMPEKRRFQAVIAYGSESNPEKANALLAKSNLSFRRDTDNFAMKGYRVRRLTPTECERLQGYPDGWTEGHSDTTRYKALGNSVAIPCVEFVIGSIKRFVEVSQNK